MNICIQTLISQKIIGKFYLMSEIINIFLHSLFALLEIILYFFKDHYMSYDALNIILLINSIVNSTKVSNAILIIIKAESG